MELTIDLVLAHAIEVVGHRDLAREEAQPARHRHLARRQRHDLDQWLTGFGDDEALSLGRALDQTDRCVFTSCILTLRMISST